MTPPGLGALFSHFAWGTPGSGPLVMVHGFLGSAHDWKDLAMELSETRRVIAVDLPGHGDALPPVPGNYGLTNAANYTLEAARTVCRGPFHLVGYSMGARVAMKLASAFPDRVLSLILVSGMPGIQDPEERAIRRQSDAQLAARLRSEPLDRFLRWWYAKPLFATLRNRPALLKRLMRERAQGDPEAMAMMLDYLGQGAHESLWEEFARLPMPILLLVGADDPRYIAHAHAMAAVNPKANIHVLPGCGHALHREAPMEVGKVLEDWLAGEAVSSS